MIETILYCMDLVEQEKHHLEAVIDNWDLYGSVDKLEIDAEHTQVCIHQDRLVAIKDFITSNSNEC